MKAYRSPDLIFFAFVAAALVGLVFLLGWPLVSSDGWRVFLLTTLPVIHAGLSFVWIAQPKARLFAFRLYYLVFGPRCDVQILGTVPVDPVWDDATALNEALRVAQIWRADAKETLRSSNRSVIQASGRTLTVSVVGEASQADIRGASGGAGCSERIIAIDLRGYQDKLTRTDSALHNEIQALLDGIVTDLRSIGQQATFTLRARIQGTNPFLALYLRDVPTTRFGNFQLQINANEYGNDVTVTVRADSITVAAHNPTALVGSARRYLATPAIAHLN